jgi:hypothetical protein
MLVHKHATVDGQSRALGQLEVGTHPDAGNHEIGSQALPALQRHDPAGNFPSRLLQVKADAVLFMEFPDEIAQLGPHESLERPSLRRYDIHLQLSRPQRRGYLEPDEAGAQDHRPLRPGGCGDNGLAVGESPKVVNRRAAALQLGGKPHWSSSRGEEEGAELVSAAIVEPDPASIGLKRDNPAISDDVYSTFRVEIGRMQRNPVI